MNIAYLIIAHHQENHLARMIRTLADEHAFFFIHIDKKSAIEPFIKTIQSPRCFFIEDRVEVNWGGWSMVQATLHLMQAAVSHDVQFKYYQLLSDSCFPLKSRKQIYNHLLHSNANFITINEEVTRKSHYFDWISGYYSHDMFNLHEPVIIRHFRGIRVLIRKALQKTPYRRDMKPCNGWRWLCLTDAWIKSIITFIKENGAVLISKKFTRTPYGDMKPYKGWQWWCLTDECVKYVLTFVKENQGFVRFYKVTHIPDEMFFHTIIKNSMFSDSIVPAMGHGNITGNHYILWAGGPLTLSEEHYEELIKSESVFARKFCEIRSEHLIKKLEEAL